jgi:hypothetical protein
LFNVAAQWLHMHAQQASLDLEDQFAVEQSPLKASGVREAPLSRAGGAASPLGEPAWPPGAASAASGVESGEQADKDDSAMKAARNTVGFTPAQ